MSNFIKIIGNGGLGLRVVERVTTTPIPGVEAIVMNTDVQELRISACTHKIQIEQTNKESGVALESAANMAHCAHDHLHHLRQSTEACTKEIIDALHGAQIVLLVAGMGGRTGTDAITEVAGIAREIRIPVVCVVNKPIPWEGKRCVQRAALGIHKLVSFADSLVVAPGSNIWTCDIQQNVNAVKEIFERMESVLCDCIESTLKILRRYSYEHGESK